MVKGTINKLFFIQSLMSERAWFKELEYPQC